MDQDLVDALGQTPTAMERLYAEGLEDYRAMSAKYAQSIEDSRLANEKLDVWRTEQQRLFGEQVAAIKDHLIALEARINSMPPWVFDEHDHLYERCVRDGLELRRQQLSTATTKATEDDIMNDAFRLGGEIFRRIIARKALVVAGTLAPDAVPPAVV